MTGGCFCRVNSQSPILFIMWFLGEVFLLVSWLHGLLFWVHHLRGWRSCTFSYLSNFVAKTQHPYDHYPRFDEFTIPSLDNFLVGDRNTLLLCPIRALQKYLTMTGQYFPDISGLFISTSRWSVLKHHFFLAQVFHQPSLRFRLCRAVQNS